MMMGEDQLLRLAWTAWAEARLEAKQNQIANEVPKIHDILMKHQEMIESEKSKLHTTNDRVQSLEVDRTKLSEDMYTLRSSLDLERSRWQGMTRGLQAAKKTMHTEGDGEMLPRATQLRNALSPLKRQEKSRPLSSLVSQLPSSS